MKRSKSTLPGLTVLFSAGVLLLLAGCDILSLPQGSMSVQDRLDSFVRDLNAESRENLYQNFHPEETQMYGQMAASTSWESGPLATANRPFDIPAPVIGEEDYSTGIVAVSGMLTNVNNPDGYPFTIEMLRYNSEWRIKTLTYSVDPSNPFEVRKLH